MTSFIELVREGFVGTVKAFGNNVWKIVIMDPYAKNIFHSACQDFDLLSENVTAIELITTKKNPAPTQVAIYFVTPSLSNVELIIRDFPVKTPKFKSAKIFFLNEPSSEITQLLSSSASSNFFKYKVIHITYFPFESKVFNFKKEDSFVNLYCSSTSKSRAEIQLIAEKLASVCISLNENPVIRYQAIETGLNNPQAIALALQSELDSYTSKHPEFPTKDVSSRGRAVLIITDRSIDPFAPILHELTYQAMVADLLGLEDGKRYSHKYVNGLGIEVEEEVILDESDPVWNSLRHMHIADCIQELVKQFKASVNENPAAANMLKRAKGGNNASLQEMRDIISSVPELQEISKRFSVHMDIAARCMDLIKNQNLDPAIDTEQNISIGLTAEGEPVKNIIANLAPLLTNPSLSSQKKLRLLLTLTASKQTDYDRRRLETHAGLSDEEKMSLNNFSYLLSNKPLIKPKETSRFVNPFRRNVKPKDEDENPYALSRYTPQFKKVILDQISKTITPEEFPFVKEEESIQIKNPIRSLRVNRPNWQKKAHESNPTAKNSSKKAQAGPIILFMAGGMSYSEIRSAYEISKALHRDIFVGTTNIATPADFINCLSGMSFKAASLPTSKRDHGRISADGLPSPLPTPSPTSIQAPWKQALHSQQSSIDSSRSNLEPKKSGKTPPPSRNSNEGNAPNQQAGSKSFNIPKFMYFR
ncbi:Sec1-like protein [Neoconidiobolus thromboides FSU 785]|nr:Sec1-like protein [Neoconidiobolus thromboides FSU 785]